MSNENLRYLRKTDLLNIIGQKQCEIDKLKAVIENLEKKIGQQETKINDQISNKHNELLSYLEQTVCIEKEIQEELNTNKINSKSENEEIVQNITNEETIKENEVIDTKEKSQIVKGNPSCNMLMVLPTNTDLAIIEPKFIGNVKIDFKFKVILIVIYIISIMTILFSLKHCVNIYKQDEDIQELTKNIQMYILENQSESENNVEGKLSYSINFDELNNLNSDTIGWLKVDGIDINMPIVQTDNNNYYLKHSFDKTDNLSGWAFADYRNKFDGLDKNIVIYGHNRRDNIIFSSLTNILKPDWYNNKDNKNITFIEEKGEQIYYDIFSVYQIEAEDYYIKTDFSSDDKYKEFLDTLKKRSIKNYDIELNEKNQILTLSTCGRNSKYRVVLHAVKKLL